MLEKLVDRRSDYQDVHVIKALLLLAKKPLGREGLMKELGLGEASARTLLGNMRKFHFIKPTTKGHVLERVGESFVSKFAKHVEGPKYLGKTSITVSDFNVAYLVRNKARKISRGIEQRDIAVHAGADGLTTLVCKGNELQLAGVKSKVPREIKALFRAKNGDVILIGSAKDRHTADFAALKAALSLL